MASSSEIRENMEVIGADGGHVGTGRPDRSGGLHHYVPLGMVADVEGDRVRVSFNAELAPQFWEEEGSER